MAPLMTLKKKITRKEPTINLKIGPTYFSALIDTGSSVTLIKSSAFNLIEDGLKFPRKNNLKIFDASGNVIPETGSFYVRATLNNFSIDIPVIVVADSMNFKHPILLGMDVIDVYKFRLDFAENKLTFGNTCIGMQFDQTLSHRSTYIDYR